MIVKSSIFQDFRQLWYGPDLVHVQGRRERRMLMLGSAAMLLMGVAWGIFFSAVGNWPLVALDMVLVLGGLCVALLVWRKQPHIASIVSFTTLFTVVCLIAWVFDSSTPQAPRTTHLYLLPLSVAALMAFRSSGVWLRHGVALACLLAFAVLSVGYGSPLPQYALPQEVRATGAWVQIAASMLILYGMLHVMQNDAAIRSVLETELLHALEQEQFELHYQPQLNSAGRVVGAEALIRWAHPERGLVLPGRFIEAAEQTGLILPIGRWVLHRACEQLRDWAQTPGCAHLHLAVNISQVQFRQKDFVAEIVALIDRYGIDASLLELEITESMLVQDLSDIVHKMTALRGRGVSFSLDDFGTGYASLNHLKNLPLNQLKIDQSFVRDLLTDANDASIARTVIALGHNLGLSVIAEGVESREQRDFLASCGCELFQGFLFSRALPAAAFNAYVRANALSPGIPELKRRAGDV